MDPWGLLRTSSDRGENSLTDRLPAAFIATSVSRKRLCLPLPVPPLLRLVVIGWPRSVHDSAVFTTLHTQKAQNKNKKNWQAEAVWTLQDTSAFGVNQAWVSKETKTFKAVFVLESILWNAVAVYNLSLVCGHKRPLLLRFVAVDVLQCFQLFNQRFVLIFQHCDAVLQTLDILLLFPATLARCLSAGGREEKQGFLVSRRKVQLRLMQLQV